MAQETISYDSNTNYEGNDITVGFNPRYLLDVLSLAPNNDIKIYLADSFSPILIQFVKNEKNNIHADFVIMPVKV